MRRPIAARDAGWAKALARSLARLGIRPNTVSVASVVFAALAAVCLVTVSRDQSRTQDIVLFLGAALCIQLRLLCNLFDGMLAVEFKKSSPLGAIYNDFPDRPADVLILLGCAHSGGPAWMPVVGWTAAALALLTAYVRVLGVAIGAREYFTGPMAKQHRMAAATLACVLCAGESAFGQPPRAMAFVLMAIAAGCVLTIARRLRLIGHDLVTTAQIGRATPSETSSPQ